MTPVLIVGGGPVGLALALILARYHVSSLILEARIAPTPRDESRAIAWMPRGLDLLDWLGLTATFEQIGVRRIAHEFWSKQKRLLALRFDQLNHPHPYSLLLPQHDTEAMLEAAARATGYVEIRREHRVIGATNQADCVVADVEGPDGQYQIIASWGVGCDGARSTIRSLLGINQHWRDYGLDSAVADFEMSCDLPENVSRLVLDVERPYGFFYFAPGRWRLIYRLNHAEERKSMTTEQAATNILLARLPTARISRFLWASAFRLGQGQSVTYGQGRWLLAGDAAHAMGPSAGAGMMIGLLGAWRLGPNLARTVHGEMSATALLQQYEREQRTGSAAVQASNALIFRNMALTNPMFATARATLLQGISYIRPIVQRITATEALTTQTTPLSSG